MDGYESNYSAAFCGIAALQRFCQRWARLGTKTGIFDGCLKDLLGTDKTDTKTLDI